MATGDILQTWIVLAREVDATNRRIRNGEPSPGTCHCDTASRLVNFHVCGQCGKDSLCQDMDQHVYGYRACPSCISSSGKLPSAVERTIPESVTRAVYLEFKLSHLPRNQHTKDLISTAILSLKDQTTGHSGTSYVNAFSGNQEIPPAETCHCLMFSIDAIFPFGRDQQGNARVHVADNLCIIPIALNYCKHTSLPVFMNALGQFRREYEALEQRIKSGNGSALHQLAALQCDIVKKCRQYTDIRTKVPYRKDHRMRMKIDSKQLEYLKEEWVSGKLHPGSQQQFIRRWIHTSGKRITCGWSTSQRATITRIVCEIEEWTGIQLPKYDGCPYFAHEGARPENWSWVTTYILADERLQRMTTACNRKWPTIDNAMTIFLEMIFQVCVGRMVIDNDDQDFENKMKLQGEYREFLGLPLVLDYHNPLCLVVAHKVHGQQMRTG